MNDQFNQLVDYINHCMSQGVPVHHIRGALLEHNWDPEVVDRAFAVINPAPNYTPASDSPQTVARQGGMFGRRASRRGFAMGLFYILVTVVSWVGILFLSFSLVRSSELMTILGLIFSLAGMAAVILLFVVLASLLVRRLHDLGQTGLFVLLIFVPIANLLFVLYLLLAPGNQGSNKFGLPVKSWGYLVTLGFKRP